MTSAANIDLTDLTVFTDGRDAEVLRLLRDEEPLHWNDEPDGGPGFWSITRYEDVRRVASEPAVTVREGTQIPSRRAEGEGARSIHHLDAPEHLKLRRIVVPHVRPTVVKRLENEIEQTVDELLDPLVGAGELDLVAEVSARLPLLVLGRLLGVPAADCPDILRWTNQMASQDPEYSDGPETAARARDEVFAYFRALEADRRAAPQGDLVSVLATAEVDGCPLSRGQLDAYYLILMVAGNETTRNLLSGGVHALNLEPGSHTWMGESPENRRSGVEEMLRWVSPVLCMRRTAVEPLTLHGRTVAPGEKIVMWFVSGNRDDRVFTDPDRFRPDRAEADHLGFGWGPHACLGAHLARLEAQVFFRRLHERGLVVEQTGEVDRLSSNFFRGIKHLPVRITEAARV
ncbi:cytochrome P450 [Actinomycetospora rhizophila]|uniref:Cytochrome P450 n=1 Tax=Actinomycetospora rhizophila TaxID=1416876 RepID=A0ABV9ZED9_9PSEU